MEMRNITKWKDEMVEKYNGVLLAFCGPRISRMRSHSNGETPFLFRKMIFEKFLKSSLIFALFLKGKTK